MGASWPEPARRPSRDARAVPRGHGNRGETSSRTVAVDEREGRGIAAPAAPVKGARAEGNRFFVDLPAAPLHNEEVIATESAVVGVDRGQLPSGVRPRESRTTRASLVPEFLSNEVRSFSSKRPRQRF